MNNLSNKQIKDTFELSLGLHLALLILVPCWNLYWIYRITDYLNRIANFEKRKPLNKMLLCAFIPFYFVYWVNKSAKYIDLITNEIGIESKVSTPCTLLGLFSKNLASVVLQQRVNVIHKCEIKNIPTDKLLKESIPPKVQNEEPLYEAVFFEQKQNNHLQESINTTQDTKEINVGVYEYSGNNLSKEQEILIPSFQNNLPIEVISQNAFYGCDNLVKITLPSTIKTIGDCAFCACSNLKTIIFDGTLKQWNEITKGEFWDAYTPSYTVYCKDGEIKK